DERAVTVAFLGSSRTGDGIQPALAEDFIRRQTGRPCVAHSFFVPGNGAVGELVLWKRLLDRGQRLDVVVAEIAPLRFVTAAGQPPDYPAWPAGRMTRSEVRFVQNYGFPADVDDEWEQDNWNPWFGFRIQLLGRVRQKWLPPHTLHLQRLPTTN